MVLTLTQRACLVSGFMLLIVGLDRLLNFYWRQGMMDVRASFVVGVGIAALATGLASLARATRKHRTKAVKDGKRPSPTAR